MSSTRLAQRLALESYTAADADYWGDATPETWTRYRACWGNVRSGSGREQNREGVEATVDAIVRIRHPRDGRIPQAQDRVVFDEGETTRTLNIEHVNRVDERRRWLDLYCREDV